MPKLIYVPLVALSVAFCACTKADMEPIDNASGGVVATGGVVGAGGVVGTGGIVGSGGEIVGVGGAAGTTGVCQDPSTYDCVSSSGSCSSGVCHVGSVPAWGSCSIQGNVDNCGDGTVCLTPMPGIPASFCFPLCHDLNGCNGFAGCSGRPWSGGGLLKVCDPQYVSCSGSPPANCCDPTDTTSALCGPQRYCYLVAPQQPGNSWTVCDYTSGGLKNQPCASYRDCVQGYTCFSPSGTGTGTCVQVCNPNDKTACNNRGCQKWGAQYGVCPAA